MAYTWLTFHQSGFTCMSADKIPFPRKKIKENWRLVQTLSKRNSDKIFSLSKSDYLPAIFEGQ